MSISPQIILDASAIIAYLDDEPGSDVVEQWLPNSAASMVNICEVISVLVREGKPEEQVSQGVLELVPTIVPFGWEIARITAGLIAVTQAKGLGLGDRAALATAQIMKLPVLTAESRWLDVPVEIDIQLIRPRRAT
jgi:ribonuclease VapC